ncbi:MAG: alpha/beta fold hydrolase [Gemmataceae bacterium]
MLALLLAVTLGPVPAATPEKPVAEKAATEKAALQTIFVKVGPMPGPLGRSPGQERAVVLIHGLGLHLIHKDRTFHAHLRPWQESDSKLVRRLAEDSDVYALAYAQNVAVDTVASSPELARHLKSLQKAGYRQIILIGHSAGGLIARHVVEDNPHLGVTRVIQVCSPNGGSGWAALKTARAAQMPFLNSLTRSTRDKILETRADKRIPESVAFACVIGSCNLKGDGVVWCRSQWTGDLQQQGIPAYMLKATHWDAMTCSRTPDFLARLVVEPMPRWDSKRVTEARKAYLGG